VTALERERLMQIDEFGRGGWGRAAWPEWMIKGGVEFWLPLPEEVLQVANGAIEDYSVAGPEIARPRLADEVGFRQHPPGAAGARRRAY
jgi:hypothetical protein